MTLSFEQITGSPGGWTRVGSPEWLEELFPGWTE
jgi:hypothetical protein